MKDKNKKAQPAVPQDDEKIDVSKSVFQNIREMNEQRLAEEQERQAEIEREYAERERKRQEEYDRRIIEEKKELMRLKQGLIEESETIHEEHEEAVRLSPWQKVKNFVYHNKWWLVIALFFALVVAVLVNSIVTKPRPDMVVLVVCNNDKIGEAEGLRTYFEGFAEDFNGNGEVLVSVYYMPLSDNTYKNYSYGTDTKLTVEMQSADAVIVIAGDDYTQKADVKSIFTDLSDEFPDNENVRKFAFYLRGTDFAEKIGVSKSAVTDDLYMAVRTPKKLAYCDLEDMQKTYDKDLPVFKKVVEDLSE